MKDSRIDEPVTNAVKKLKENTCYFKCLIDETVDLFLEIYDPTMHSSHSAQAMTVLHGMRALRANISSLAPSPADQKSVS